MFFVCQHCGAHKKFSRASHNKFCSNQCQSNHEFVQRYERFIAGDTTAFRTNKSLRRAVTHRDHFPR